MEISEGSGQTRVKSFFLHISVNTNPFSNARLCRDSTQTQEVKTISAMLSVLVKTVTRLD